MPSRSDLRPFGNGAIVVLLLLLIAGVGYWNTRRIADDNERVVHTHEVLDALEVMLSAAKDAETGQRGYVITGDHAFLAPYEAATAQIERQAQRFANLTRDNPAQQARIPELRRLLQEKADGLKATLDELGRGGFDAAREAVRSGRAKRAMDALRDLVGQMKGEEERLMAERTRRAERSYRFAAGSMVASTALGLLLVGLLSVLSARNLRLRTAAAEAIAEQKELYRTTLASIGDGVITTDVDARVTFLNGVAVDLTGWTPEDAGGAALTEVFSIVNETTRRTVENPAMRALRDGHIVGLANHTVLLSRDGSERPIDDSAAPIRSAAGEVKGAVLVFRDVTEQRGAHLALLASEARKSAVLETALDCIVTIDHQSRILEFNPAAERTFGRKRADVLGADMAELLIPADRRDEHRRAMATYLATGEGLPLGRRIEITALRADGSAFPVEASIVSVDRDGLPELTAYVRDISSRKRAEQVLAERMNLLELGADVAAALIQRDTLRDSLQTCAEAVVKHLDAALARIWTFDEQAQELNLRASAGLGTALDGPYGTVRLGDREIGRIAQQRTRYATNEVRHDAGVPDQDWVAEEGLVSFAGYPLIVEERLVGVMAMYARRPLSETTLDTLAAASRQIAAGVQRKRADETVVELLARERIRAERLGLVATASGTINSAMTQSSVVGVVRGEAKRILAAGGSELILDGPDAPAPPEDALCVPLVGRGGRAIGTLCLTRDDGFDDEDRAVLTQLANMAAVAFENARLYEELRDADRRKDAFLATLAHELRNPLAPIRNALRILRLTPGDQATGEHARAMIDRQIEQVVRLVDDLLDVSRISRGKLHLRLERVELSSVLEAAVETSRPLIEEGKHTLNFTQPEEPLWIEGDPTRLAQVFLNLLNNAAKYTLDGGEIVVTVQRREATVMVEVRDTGIGIPADDLPRVFDMFMQVENRTLERTQGGLGIGLTLVKELVELHHGTIEAHSDGAGAGSAFVVRLPLAAAPGGDVPQGSGSGWSPDDGGGGDDQAMGRKHRILVVDDNRDAVESLGILLEMMGYEIRTAEDGIEALEIASGFAPDVVLLDIGLPRLNGYETAQRMRQLDGGGDIFLVALTGWGQDEDRRRSREAGFDHHLVKPVDPDALDELLKQYARRGRGEGTPS